ncbi:MAG: hypothetical protein HY319_10355 [Armatimonadetes bacterium]|nr:hypothetical protein [Armatimonadota bacterium]
MSTLTEFTRIRTLLEQRGCRHAGTGPNSEKKLGFPTPGDPKAYACGFDTQADFLENRGRVDSLELSAHLNWSEGTHVVFELQGEKLRKVVMSSEFGETHLVAEQVVDASNGEILSETPAADRGQLSEFDHANLDAWQIAV